MGRRYGSNVFIAKHSHLREIDSRELFADYKHLRPEFTKRFTGQLRKGLQWAEGPVTSRLAGNTTMLNSETKRDLEPANICQKTTTTPVISLCQQLKSVIDSFLSCE